MTGVPNKKIELDPGFWTKTSWIQLLYGIWVNMAQLSIGLAFGLPAVQVPQLSSPESNVPITRHEASWIASVLSLFSPIGCLFSGYIMDRFGRKIMIIVCHCPMCIGWLCTGLAKSPKQIIIGRAITGIGCGMAMGPPRIYTTEISLPNMRGVIGAFPALALSLGISIQAGLGNFFTWEILCYICSAFTITNLFTFLLLPETPYYVLKTGTTEQARLTLAKFRGPKYDIDAEMNQLLEFKTDNDIRKLTFKESIKALFTRSSCLPFGLINTYIIITQTSGASCILMWAVEILTEAKSSFNVNTGNFLLALTRVVVGTLTSVLLFKVGRKPMALTSAVGVSFISFSLGFYIYYNDEPSLVPQCCYMVYMAFASLGYYTLPFLIASELYPLQVRGLLGGITVSMTSLLIFGSTKVFPMLVDSIGLAYTMVIFGACSLMGAIFLYFYLPETKELTLQEIEEYYNSRRPTLVSQRRLVTLQNQKVASTTSKPNKSKTKSITIQKSTEPYKPLQMSSRVSSKVLAKLDSKKKLSSILGGKYFTKGEGSSDSKSISSADSLKKEFSLVNKESISIKDAFRSKESMQITEPVKSNESDQSEKIKSVEYVTDNVSKKNSKEHITDNASKKTGNEHVTINEHKHKELTIDNASKKSSKEDAIDNTSKKSSKEHTTDNSKKSNSNEHATDNVSKKSSKEYVTDNVTKKSNEELATENVKNKNKDHATEIEPNKSSKEDARDNESKKSGKEHATDNVSKRSSKDKEADKESKKSSLRQLIEHKSKITSLRQVVEQLIKKKSDETVVKKESKVRSKEHIADTEGSKTSDGTDDDSTKSKNQPSTSKKR